MMETYYDEQGWPSDSDELLEGWLRYVDYMVRHFHDRVAYFEICNEWDHLDHDEYIRVAKATIPVIRSADPDAKIMLGSTHGGFRKEGIIACLQHTEIATKIDAIGWHPFYQTNPDADLYANYRQDVLELKRQCESLGFRGQYAATEWTWAAPYPPVPVADLSMPDHMKPLMTDTTEIVKAKYSAQVMAAHSGLDIISLYNETFQSGKIDWDVTLLRNAFQADPISPPQPQPIYYVFRTLSSALDGFRATDFPVHFAPADREFDSYTFARGDSERLVATWVRGMTTDGIVEAKTALTLPGSPAKHAWAIDTMNGTEQELILERRGSDAVLEGILVKDYPVLIRLANS